MSILFISPSSASLSSMRVCWGGGREGVLEDEEERNAGNRR